MLCTPRLNVAEGFETCPGDTLAALLKLVLQSLISPRYPAL